VFVFVASRAFRSAPTVNDLFDRYVAEHVEQKNRPATRKEFKRIVERDLRPELGRHKVDAVTRQDIAIACIVGGPQRPARQT
jgi:hypothetical protein